MDRLPICMTEGFWRNSQLSLAARTGSVKVDDHVWMVVNSRGMDLFECSDEAERMGRDMAIPAGEPADLVRKDFVKYYKRLGRDRFFEVLKGHPQATDKELTDICKELTKKNGKKI